MVSGSYRSNPAFAVVLASLIALVTQSTVSAIDCFTGPSVTPCTTWIDNFCATVVGGNPHDLFGTTDRCYYLSTLFRSCTFVANGNGTTTLSDCQAALHSVATSCPSGGTSSATTNQFTFRMDPATGLCSEPTVTE